MTARFLFTTEPSEEQIIATKALIQRNGNTLGFVVRAFLFKQARKGELLVMWRLHPVNVVGAINFHLRKDGIITIYEIVVDAERRRSGIGRSMIAVLKAWGFQRGAHGIKLKCTVDNVTANTFYHNVGFRCTGEEKGRKRKLQLWWMDVGNGLLAGVDRIQVAR